MKNNKASESRPRFRMSIRSGMNLRMHPNAKDKIIPSLGMIDSGFEPQRIDDRGPMQVSLRACLKDLYGIRKSKLTGSTIVRASTSWKYKNIERRLDVLMHRSGLVNSIGQARQIISHGHVLIKKESGIIKIKRPGYIVCKNVIVYIEGESWHKFSNMSIKQWSKWDVKSNMNRIIPPYMEVDYVNGSFVLINEPNKNTILIPAGLGKTILNSLYSTKG